MKTEGRLLGSKTCLWLGLGVWLAFGPTLASAGKGSIVAQAPAPAGRTVQLETLGKVKVGGQAPWLAGFDLRHPEQVINLTGILSAPGQNRTLIAFWATWCPPCIEGLEQLKAAESRLKAARVGVVLVDVADDRVKALARLDGIGITWPTLEDTNGANAEQYGVMERLQKDEPGAIPEDESRTLPKDEPGAISKDEPGTLPKSVLVSSDGKVLAIFAGEGPDWVERVLAAGR